MDGYVTIRRYLDPIEAHLDRTRLESEDIRARVTEPTGFNPLLTGAAGGITLDVRIEDAERADRVLSSPAPEVVDDEEEDDASDVVRCPRCELEYCSFERPRLRSSGAASSPFIAMLALPFRLFARKRWRCERCEHVWDDAREGPKRMTRLLPGDPRPIFRLRRSRSGTGLFLGLALGWIPCAVLATLWWPAIALFPLVVVLGHKLGDVFAHDVCSEPRCREPLPPGAETCPACRGSVAGRVQTAAEHYAAAADFRREVAAERAKDEARAKKRRKKRAKAPARDEKAIG